MKLKVLILKLIGKNILSCSGSCIVDPAAFGSASPEKGKPS